MTLDEAIEDSKKRPREYYVWMGDRMDAPPTRDQAFFFLGNNLRQGSDAFGHASTEGYVIRNGFALAHGTILNGNVHLENFDPEVTAELLNREP